MIINTWDQIRAAGGTGVAISWRPRQAVTPACWFVWRLVGGREVPTDPGAAWYNHGHKTFLPFGVSKQEALEQAKAWVAEQYGPQEWTRNRMGDYVAKAINQAHPIPKREEVVP